MHVLRMSNGVFFSLEIRNKNNNQISIHNQKWNKLKKRKTCKNKRIIINNNTIDTYFNCVNVSPDRYLFCAQY